MTMSVHCTVSRPGSRHGCRTMIDCPDCGCPYDRCVSYGPGRKCCPDCRHTTGAERWEPIRSYEDFYSISDHARVLRHARLIARVHTAPYWSDPAYLTPVPANQH